jgi:uncharacterized protein YyaL (SSP411 family)
LTKENRLIHEISPYLIQHARNPIDWYPWGDEALERAKAEDKPILLSSGYSSCHWCHVMARESFEDEATAELMNENFINIKVDREERPDLDAIYMRAVVAMSGRGGWPLTVFLTPEGKPFFGGTYFPPEERHGLPAFRQVLESASRAYKQRKDDIMGAAQGVLAHILQQDQSPGVPSAALSPVMLDEAVKRLRQRFDAAYGGFGVAPKFPQATVLDFLLRSYHRTGNREALRMVERTLEKMAQGGMYDQLGGGFHRYSVDRQWLVPHFEKMLYDNALLSRLYIRAYQATGKPFYRKIAEETLDYVAREMTSSEGGFYSSQDADSEGEEGKFYVWTPGEITAVLGEEEGAIFNQYFAVTEEGNFHGKNVLSTPRYPDVAAHLAGVSQDRFDDIIVRGRERLLAAREERARPGRDDKVITAWNGLMLASFAEAARALHRDDYRGLAVRNADFLLGAIRHDSHLSRTYADGQARVRGYLEDYTCLSDGLLALHEATFDDRWFTEAQALVDAMLSRFKDPAGAGFYDTDGKEALITRPRNWEDSSLPSANAIAAHVLLRLAALTGNGAYEKPAVDTLIALGHAASRYPSAFAVRARSLPLSPRGNRHRGRSCGPRHPRVAGHCFRTLPSQQGGRSGPPERGRRPSDPPACGKDSVGWTTDGLRVSPLCLPATRQYTAGPGGPLAREMGRLERSLCRAS